MAIKKSITDVNGITYDSYTRIRKVVLETQYDGTTLAEIHLEIYASEAFRSKDDDSARKQPLKKGLYQVTGDSYNTYFVDSVLANADNSPLKQAYAWLKSYNDTEGRESMFHIDWTTGTTDV